LAKTVFFQLNSKQKVCSSRRIYIAPFLSQSNKTLPNTCFASEPYSIIHGLFGNFPVGLISWVHLCTSRNNMQPTSRCSKRQRLRSQHKRRHYASCLNWWQYQVWTLPLLSQKFPFKRRSSNENATYNWQQKECICIRHFASPRIQQSQAKFLCFSVLPSPRPASRQVSHVTKTKLLSLNAF